MKELINSWRCVLLEAKRVAKENGAIRGDVDLAERITEYLEDAGYPGVDRGAVNHWLKGRNPPSIIQFIALCKALNINPSTAFPSINSTVTHLPSVSAIKKEVLDFMDSTTDRGRAEIALFSRQTVARYPRRLDKQTASSQ